MLLRSVSVCSTLVKCRELSAWLGGRSPCGAEFAGLKNLQQGRRMWDPCCCSGLQVPLQPATFHVKRRPHDFPGDSTPRLACEFFPASQLHAFGRETLRIPNPGPSAREEAPRRRRRRHHGEGLLSSADCKRQAPVDGNDRAFRPGLAMAFCLNPRRM